MERRIWSHEELLVALELYCRTPFGLFHTGNREIQEVAAYLGRTPSALAMKLSNFAALDPVHQTRGIKGLKNGAKADRLLMHEFLHSPEPTIQAASEAFQTLVIGNASSNSNLPTLEEELLLPVGSTEKTRLVQIRVVQRFFRNAVLSSYDFKCAFCDLNTPELLNASHIIPWKSDESQRSNPRNGLALCAIHDRAFDRGLISIGESSEILLSPRLNQQTGNSMFETAFNNLAGSLFTLPRRFAPTPESLAYHRKHIFQD
jgi:putative restriction endonuclease